MSISQKIRDRLKEDKKRFFANDNISKYIYDGELELLQEEVTEKVKELLQSLVIDIDQDHNTHGTAKRIAKMYLKEVFSGRYISPPKITVFPNDKHFDEIYTLGPIDLRSACSHHFVEIEGQVWIGIYPSNTVVGISKIARLIDWVARRPHIQEEMSIILADELEALIKPMGLGVVIKAKHHCMTWRGVEEKDTTMISSVVRGLLRQNIMKDEFFSLIKSQGF